MLQENDIYRIISTGDSLKKGELLNSLPDNTLKDAAYSLATSQNPLANLLGFGTMLPSYCQGVNCSVGANLAKALYRYGKDLFLSGEYSDLFLMTVLQYANNFITALINLSKFEIAENFIAKELPFWESYENNPGKLKKQDYVSFIDNLKSILVNRVNILINLNQIEQAWDLAFSAGNVFNPRLKGNPASDIELNRLGNKLKEIKRNLGQLDENEEQRKAKTYSDQQESTNTILDSLKKMMEQQGMDPGIIDLMKNSRHVDPYSRSGFKQLDDILSEGESFLKKNTNEVNDLSVRQSIRKASSIFVDNKPSEDQILNSLDVLQKALNSALQLSNNDLINDAYYGLYLCYSRLKKSSEAADQLIYLRNNLEKIRKGITDPLERGGVFQKYPYLFYSSVEHMYKAHRFDDMLDAMEGSKGRAIIDILEKESLHDSREFDLYQIRERLHPILLKQNTNYVSFHVDDTCSYACLVTKSGEIYAHQIQIGKDWLDKYYQKNLQNPASWNNQFKKIDIIDELNPFVSIIEECLENKKIEQGDHICYSADHLLYLFPVHYLEINNKSLIELFTVSRIHNAGHLIALLSKPPVKFVNSLSLEVPSVEDYQKDDLAKLFSQNSILLNTKFKANHHTLHLTQCTIKNLLSHAENQQLVHFSAHGFFPLHDNPYDNSGLLLADDGKLPVLHKNDPNYKYKNEGLHLLSPERLLQNEKTNFTDSHISLEACVAGYAREGIGGDALGIEWAFFQEGAISLISTFWNIDINNANEFYKIFYEEWLDKNKSKAVAHQQAILNLKQMNHRPDYPNEYFWAGYGLIGDWR